MDELDELLPEFLSEAIDILEKVNQQLDLWASLSNRAELLDGVNRGIHTIKGSSSMFGFVNTQAVAHELETFTMSLKAKAEEVTEADIVKIRNEVQKLEQLLNNKDQFPSAIIKNESSPDSQSQVQTDDFIRVPIKRLNDTLNSIAEIFLIRNQMVYLVERLKSGSQEQKDFLQSFEMLDSLMRRGIGDLERSAMGMRMVSVQGIFSRMARVVQTY